MPLGDEELQAMILRDKATEGGFAIADYHCAEDRHQLLIELNRLRTVIHRLHSAQPLRRSEGLPWLSE